MDGFDPINSEEPLILVKPPYWAALAGFFFLILCFVAYAFFGSIPVTVSGNGSLLNQTEVVGVVSPASMPRIREGMPAEVAFTIADSSLYGRVVGAVSSVSHDQIRIALTLDAQTASGYRWTSHQGPPFKIPVGAVCTFQVTVENEKPISYLFACCSPS